MKIISWNVNGLRAAMKKGFDAFLHSEDPDILCLQETKAQDEEVLAALNEINGYQVHTYSAVKKGYSGTAILSKLPPISVQKGIGMVKHDQEGRVITAEYPKFYVVTVYTPNAGRELVRLDYRATWDKAFKRWIKRLHSEKPVIICGDLNVAHQSIDLARPKSNYNKTAGYTQTEIDGMTSLLKLGLVDSYRSMHPDEIAYTYWSYMFNARKKNVGWRIDYFLVSKSMMDQVEASFMLPEIEGSDHCPIVLSLQN